jgi:hypothetical protein
MSTKFFKSVCPLTRQRGGVIVEAGPPETLGALKGDGTRDGREWELCSCASKLGVCCSSVL